MTSTVKRWLASQLSGLDSVRSASIDDDGRVVARTWSGTLIRAYLLDAPIKARALRKIIQDATRIGVGTLLIIDAKLIPDDGERFTPDEGLIALHALYKDKFYTYRYDKAGPRIGQAHLRQVGRGDEREIWYGPDIEIRHLPCYRVWVKAPPTIKGDWLMASFGSEAFWKATDYHAMREILRQQQRSHNPTYQVWNAGTSWSPPTSEPASPPPPPRSPLTKLEQSFAHLGLPASAGSDEVKAAFRRMARECHPDVSNLPKAEAETRFKRLYAAYIYIKSANGW